MLIQRTPFCERVTESLQEQLETWTLLTDPASGHRQIEHAWSRMDRGWGSPPSEGVELMALEEFRARTGDSALRQKLEDAVAVVDYALRLPCEGPMYKKVLGR